MADSQDHLTRAKAHFDTANAIVQHGEFPWGAVALFYAGMHVIHAGLPLMPNLSIAQQHPESHTGKTFMAEGTLIVVQRYVSMLHLPYSSLHSMSVDVRYNGYLPGRAEADNLRNVDLRQIARWACGLVHGNPGCTCWLQSV